MSEEIDVTITHEESGDSKSIKIPISEQIAAWRKVNLGELKVDDLYKMIEGLFEAKKERRFSSPNIVGYTREDGTEMIRFEGPNIWGGAMSAAEWNEMLKKEMSSFIVTDPNFVKDKE